MPPAARTLFVKRAWTPKTFDYDDEAENSFFLKSERLLR